MASPIPTNPVPPVDYTPTDFLPPVSPWSGASNSLVSSPADAWVTPSEAIELIDTPNYDETVRFLKRLCEASTLFSLQIFGETSLGRPLYAVLASRAKSLTPAGLQESGLPLVLVQAGLHPGEIEGKDAGLMLLRDIAFKGRSSLLDQAHLLFVPVFNADGHERVSPWNRPNQRGPVSMGWRTTAQNLNLNRDYAKADCPEMRAMLDLFSVWNPALVVDVHSSDGIDHAYDLTYMFHGHGGNFAYSPKIGAWLDEILRPAVDASLKTFGHTPGPYLEPVSSNDPNAGFSRMHYGPRYGLGYCDLRHTAYVLIETHSLKPYRQRVLATRVFLEVALKTAGDHRRELAEAARADSLLRPATVPANWTIAGARSTMDYQGIGRRLYVSKASGVEEVSWTGIPETYRNVPLLDYAPAFQLPRPKAYWIPPSKSEVIDRLRLHGIHLESPTPPDALDLVFYRAITPTLDAEPFEARQRVTSEFRMEVLPRAMPPGSVRVSTDQSLGDLAISLLDPHSSDSFFSWGFFSEILQCTEYMEGYVIAPLAEHMLSSDAALRAEFDAKLNMDEAFRSDPEARLRWFYQRSPFYDQEYLLYPVGLEMP